MANLTKNKISFWHRLAHWFGFVTEFLDVYCKEDDDYVYMCHRCTDCNGARDEHVIGTKELFLSPLASFKEDMPG
jgi:hypothetical protein